ncbi:hypothetical protein VKT23_000050 [Stygiomarasmius scandens]|uniref:glucan 1,3-beta-glucosidase n=1 Tax=Marasmiellus scandens TaxID=2682957 RepID=A0ABR1K3E7_9AGAR
MAHHFSSTGEDFREPLASPGLPPNEHDAFLDPPRVSYLHSGTDTPVSRDSVLSGNNSAPLLSAAAKAESDFDNDRLPTGPGAKRRRIVLGAVGLAVLAVVVLAVVLPVYFTVIKPRQNNFNTSSSGGSGTGDAGSGTVGGGSGNPASPSGATSGSDGSQVIMADGTEFTYQNKFGGFWVSDPKDPFNNNARPNLWTPPLNSSWNWETDRIFGVNLGGLFVIEPFITPSFFEKYPGTIDEWTLSEAMAADTASGGLDQLEQHYDTFITEQDIAQIAGAGLNWIRLPIPFWAIETWPGEPFLAKTSWKYILRILSWCRKYGLRVNLDLHTVPGSQNGYNHSGKFGQVNFLNGVMGIANAQRALNYIRIIAEFIAQEQYTDVVQMFGIVNEALIETIGLDQITSFYLEAYNIIRGITGIGEGKGPYISIHDGFAGLGAWSNFLRGADRFILDTHPYLAFGGGPNDDPIATGLGADAGGIWPKQACDTWGPGVNKSRSTFGITVAGEFSNGYNDCGLFLKGVPGSHTYGGDCSLFQDASNWNETLKAGVKAFALASMDSMQNWFFWTWKIGNSSANNRVESPLWSYKLGLELGFIPDDPRDAVGACAVLGVNEPWDGTFQPWMTGGAGAGDIPTSSISEFGQWPPTRISGVPPASMEFLPTYTPTGTVATLPPPTFTGAASTISSGNGWFDSEDTVGAPTPIPGCTYPDAWDAIDAQIPASLCGSGATSATTPAPR